jgi:hypothetical protein
MAATPMTTAFSTTRFTINEPTEQTQHLWEPVLGSPGTFLPVQDMAKFAHAEEGALSLAVSRSRVRSLSSEKSAAAAVEEHAALMREVAAARGLLKAIALQKLTSGEYSVFSDVDERWSNVMQQECDAFGAYARAAEDVHAAFEENARTPSKKMASLIAMTAMEMGLLRTLWVEATGAVHAAMQSAKQLAEDQMLHERMEGELAAAGAAAAAAEAAEFAAAEAAEFAAAVAADEETEAEAAADEEEHAQRDL